MNDLSTLNSRPDEYGTQPLDQFDLVQALNLFLHSVGLLPISSAHSVKQSSRIAGGRLFNHRLCDDIGFEDICFLLSALSSDCPKGAGVDQVNRLLQSISRIALIPSFTQHVANHFGPILPELASRWLLQLGIQENGSYTSNFNMLWSEKEKASGLMIQSTSESVVLVEQIKSQLRLIMSAFGILLGAHPNLFPFLLLLVRHPLLRNDPFELLPTPIATNLSLEEPLPHGDVLYQDPIVYQILLSLFRLLSVAPHLPFPGLTPRGWRLSVALIHILKFHPRRGARHLAWLCWRFWQGAAGSGDQSMEVRDQFVWKHSRCGVLSVESNYKAPWPSEIDLHSESPANTNSLCEDLILVEDQLTFKWEFHISSARSHDSKILYQTVSRAVDSWVLISEESHRLKEDTKTCQEVLSSPEEMLPQIFVEQKHLSRLVVSVEGSLMLKFCFLPSGSSSYQPNNSTSSQRSLLNEVKDMMNESFMRETPFVCTDKSRKALRSLSHLISTRLPILLSGPPSSGKLSVLEHLWFLLWKSDTSANISTYDRASFEKNFVVLNLASRTLDAKSLIGSYVSSSQDPGQFVFVEGPLVSALREGKWLLCQDIDRASEASFFFDVLCVINLLADNIKHSAIYEVGGGIAGHNGEHGVGIDLGGQLGWMSGNERFQLLATRTLREEDHPKHFIGEQYWSEVRLDHIENSDVLRILSQHAPGFTDSVLNSLVNTWVEASFLKSENDRRGISHVTELLRWTRRIQMRVSPNQPLQSLSQNPVLQEHVFLDAVDVFLASSDFSSTETSAVKDPKLKVALGIGFLLGLNEERVKYCLYRRVPAYNLPSSDLQKMNKGGENYFSVGRAKLVSVSEKLSSPDNYSRPFALTKGTLILLERLAICISASEPILLVGETGTGKTSIVSYLAKLVGKSLISLNLSNQSDSSDLIGGYKPIDSSDEAKTNSNSLIHEFISVFGEAFNVSRNREFIRAMQKAVAKKKFNRFVLMLEEAIRALSKKLAGKLCDVTNQPANVSKENVLPHKRRKISNNSGKKLIPREDCLQQDLQNFSERLLQFVEKFIKAKSQRMRFKFVEGPLVQAIQRGDWVLLDEINLGSPETLESLTGLLRSPFASLSLSERGDQEPITRHPGFRLIACMNPATDVGKRDLPSSLRTKFTEIYVPSPDTDRQSLLTIIAQHLGGMCVAEKRLVPDIADCYSAIKELSRTGALADGTNASPHYSLRTLSRALTFATDVCGSMSLRKALVEGFYMTFLTTLDLRSKDVAISLIDKHLVKTSRNPHSLITQQPKNPDSQESSIQVGSFWLKKGRAEYSNQAKDDYILTESVKSKIVDLGRAVTTRRYPVLIQGPTSSGKTSIIEYLARITENSFVRINNHEHTDIQEYIGSYTTDAETGRLTFKEGALVRALRYGEWIVLDELNLAPSDVLEALNRLLDDNRELFIPETQEVVKPHPNFMLFATQNPPGLYGGRKVLSRAFRNRFLELHFDDVPRLELETILCQRCMISPSYAQKIVQVFTELQRRRKTDKIFDQKHSFITLRDLFRWGGRGAIGYQELAEDGYMLLAERARISEEKETVREVIEEVMKVSINESSLYKSVALPMSLVETKASRRLFKLISQALKFHEPVLLVGEAGCGKTYVCEAISRDRSQRLRCINLHRNSEVGDLLGSQRPVRNRTEKIQAALKDVLRSLEKLGFQSSGSSFSNMDIEEVVTSAEEFLSDSNAIDKEEYAVEEAQAALKRLRQSSALFAWSDGPLVKAIQEGDCVLLDEISLADDSVLERLNSLLEPGRSIVLAERGGDTIEKMKIVAHESFEIMATMNPGGDFGKRELSPALRNRFTEIWVPLVSDPSDRYAIYSARLSESSKETTKEVKSTKSGECVNIVESIISFSYFFSQSSFSAQLPQRELSLRDGIAWCDFIRHCSLLSQPLAFVHGAQMTVLDRLGTAGFGQDLPKALVEQFRKDCIDKLFRLAQISNIDSDKSLQVTFEEQRIIFGDFSIGRCSSETETSSFPKYSFSARTVARNAMRIVRALQVPKAILLEGSPGVGKTSIVEALAHLTGKRLRRINLSDQTDLLDLFGADVPVESGKPGEFAWKDAAFLDALQNGDWVLLDEMNLAPQTVLEGLNACLDHRGNVYIPELDRTFQRHPHFRVFAAQNPYHQGGSRKGLPRSLVDRFTIVFMKEMDREDLLQICAELSPSFDSLSISQMVNFNYELNQEANVNRSFASLGSPWEFNLRDLSRWLKITTLSAEFDLQPLSPVEYVDMIYTGRFRTSEDQAKSVKISKQLFGEGSRSRDHQDVIELPSQLIIGHSQLQKLNEARICPSIVSPTKISLTVRNQAEALIRCLELKLLPILTGPEHCGKTSLVKLLAAKKGAKLRTITMHSGSDTSDLLGGFEQTNRVQKLKTVVSIICAKLQAHIRCQYLQCQTPCSDLEGTLDVLRQFDDSLKPLNLIEDLDQVSQVIDTLIGRFHISELEPFTELLRSIQTCKSSCRFEWIDGPLISAMKKGEWLLVENTNLCSASVLDRLNPLFEGEGALQLPERGMHRGELEVIYPDPNFRLIFVFNPRYGELSRAMRNRGIEVAFLPDPQLNSQSQEDHQLGHSLSSPGLSIQSLSSQIATANGTHPLIYWTSQLLVHPPTEYPLLLRKLEHLSCSNSLNLTLGSVLKSLCQPKMIQRMENVAQENRLGAYFISEAFDLATAGRLSGSLDDPRLVAVYQIILVSALAYCFPLGQHPNRTGNSQNKTLLSVGMKDDSSLTELLKGFLNHTCEKLICLAPDILGKLFCSLSGSSDATDLKLLAECMVCIQEACIQILDLLQSIPDHAAIGFSMKAIEDSIQKVPDSWKPSFSSTAIELNGVISAYDIKQWDSMVRVWNLFCPQWSQNPQSASLLGEMECISSDSLEAMPLELRSVYFEVAASLKAGGAVPQKGFDQIIKFAEDLREKTKIMSAKNQTERRTKGSKFDIFELAVEKVVATSVVLKQSNHTEVMNTNFEDLLSRWTAIPFKVGVLFRLKQYLLDRGIDIDPVDLDLNLQVLKILNSEPVEIYQNIEPWSKPPNLLFQLNRASLLGSLAYFQNLVMRSTSLEDYPRVIEMARNFMRLLVSSSSYLTADRDLLTRSTVSLMIDRIEKPLWDSDLKLNNLSSVAHENSLAPKTGIAKALKIWRLYIPEIPIDPLSVRSAHHMFLSSRLLRLRQLQELMIEAENVRTGRSENSRINLISKMISELEDQSRELPKPTIQRPADMGVLHGIFKELKAFETSFLSDERLESLVHELSIAEGEEKLQTSRERIETFSVSATNLFARLSRRFPSFLDILLPIQALLHIMISELTSSFEQASYKVFSASLPLGTFMESLLAGLGSIAAGKLRRIQPDSQAQKFTSRSSVLILRIAALSVIPISLFNTADVKRLVSLYDKIWKLWTLDRIREQKEAEEKIKLFKTIRQDTTIMSDEEAEAEELQALFPSYEEEETTSETCLSCQESFAVTLAQSDILRRIHLSVTMSTSNSKSNLELFSSLRTQTVIDIAGTHAHLLPSDMDQVSIPFQIDHCSKILMHGESKSNSGLSKDFYHDSNSVEALRVISIATNLIRRIEELLEKWPETVTLVEIQARCRQICSLPSESSLARVIPMVEGLISQLEEWQGYCCNENSLETYKVKLTDLVVSWRRLELASWAGIMEREIRSFESSVNAWWFRLYELLIRGFSNFTQDLNRNEGMDEYLRSCATFLNEFMLDCNQGQFDPRLQLLRSFRQLVEHYGTVSNHGGTWKFIIRLLDGVIYFFSHSEARIAEKNQRAKDSIRSEVENYIQLASWRDINIISLKQSSKKSHIQLYKSIRKFRAVLQSPVKDLITDWTHGITLAQKSSPVIHTPEELGPLRVESILPLLPGRLLCSSSIPAYFSQPRLFLKKIGKLLESKAFFKGNLEKSSNELDELSEHIYLVAKELREEKLPKGPAGEKFAKNLDLRKRKAFSGLLKKLRLLGIGACPTDRVRDRLQDPAVILSQPLLAQDCLPELREFCEASDDSLFCLLGELPRFRSFRNQHHSDVSNSDMIRLIGSVESAVSMVLFQRSVLSNLVTRFRDLQLSLSRLSDLSNEKESRRPSWTDGTTLPEVCSSTLLVQSIFVQALNEASDTLSRLVCQDISLASSSAVPKALKELACLASRQGSEIKQLHQVTSKTLITLVKANEINSLDEIRHSLSKAVEQLKDLKKDHPELSFFLLPLSKDLHVILKGEVPIQKAPMSKNSESPVNGAFESLKLLIDSLLITMQDLSAEKSKQMKHTGSNDEEINLKKTHQLFVELTGRCHLDEIFEKLLKFNRTISILSLHADEVNSLISIASSFIQHYMMVVFEHLKNFMKWHSSNISLIQTIVKISGTISEQGFCRPNFNEETEEDTEEGNGAGPSMDGTGLGGGEGAKDVSEEIQSEEQLQGLQDDVDQENDNGDKDLSEKEDRAIETQDDLEGAELEDVQERDGKDDGGDGDNDEEDCDDNVEDGVGKVDPLDSGAVDEKFWDEQGSEDGGEEENEAGLSAKQEKEMSKDSELVAKSSSTGGEQNRPQDTQQDQEDQAPNEESPEAKDSEIKPDDDEGTETLDKGSNGEDEEEIDGTKNQQDVVPMMDHVDNIAPLDLPDELNLEDPKLGDEDMDDGDCGSFDDEKIDSESVEGIEQESIGESGGVENKSDKGGEALEADEMTGQEKGESNEDVRENDPGQGKGGFGTGDSSSGFESNIKKKKDSELAESDPATCPEKKENSKDDSEVPPEDVPMEGTEGDGVGDGEVNGKLISEITKSLSNERQTSDETTRPNPLRDLGKAEEGWRRRLQEIMDATVEDISRNDEADLNQDQNSEVEYLQKDSCQTSKQQAPGPATEDQALHKSEISQIDDKLETEDYFEGPKPSAVEQLSDAIETFKMPDTEGEDPVEMAIVGNANPSKRERDGLKIEDVDMKNYDDDSDAKDEKDVEGVKKDVELLPIGLEIRDDQTDPSLDAIWRNYQQLTQRSSAQLTEQLRLILEPTVATRLQGDYRTGKRLNMRKLVGYIASDYTKDRIWLRRTKPAQRNYKILISVDDSRSMADSRSGHLAFETLALVKSALLKLEVGEVGIAKFGSSFEVLEPFEGSGTKNPSSLDSSNPIRGFTFSQQGTDIRLAVEGAMKLFEEASFRTRDSSDETWQLAIIISDGVCQDHESIRALLRQATERRILFVFVILDSLHQHDHVAGDEKRNDNSSGSSSIVSMNSVSYVIDGDGKMEIRMERYLDSFPFDYYIILREVGALPNVLSSTLRQFFERINNS
ncbi:hypothetical protein BY996DRAFT_4638411 [Phakopsora pachyrhizi]|nr:hypothetical protein BY996DRAFT_4638411 [Phakopsora pachyrhizi]